MVTGGINLFGDILRELREENKMTQEDLGKLINVTKQAIYNYEKGDNEPNLTTLVKLSDIFNVSLDFLLGRTKQRQNLLIKNQLLLDTLNDKNKKRILLDMCKSLENYNLISRPK